MSEAEKNLEKALAAYGDMVPEDVARAARAVVSEHRAALSRARAEALEEAEEVFVEWGTEPASPTKRSFQERIRALITTPATASIPVERVREALRQVHDNIVDIASVNERTRLTVAEAVLAEVLERLGVDVDGTTPPATIPVERVWEEARRLITGHLTSEAEVRAVATLADACGANVDDLVPHEWIGRLGVDLDAKAATPADASHTCVACEHRLHAPNCCLGDKGECDCGWMP